MADVTDLVAKIDERGTRLDQVDQAIAGIRKLLPPTKRRRWPRQLRLPLAEPERLGHECNRACHHANRTGELVTLLR